IRKLTDTELPAEYDGTIEVPYCPESKLSGLMRQIMPDEKLYYHRMIQIPEHEGKRVILHFGAVDWKCAVFINGTLVREHTGGYLPFSADITEYVSDETAELLVEVIDPTDTYWNQKGKQVLNPHMIYYTAVSGIWQTVWMEVVPETYITSYKITPDLRTSSVILRLEGNKPFTYQAEVLDENGNVFACPSGNSGEDLKIEVPDPHLWTPEDPYLYHLRFRTGTGDAADSYFAMREFGKTTDQNGYPVFALNGKPYFTIGVLDQGYWPEGIYTAPSDEALKFDIQAMKDLGYNMIRKHIKVEPLRWYYWCDVLGMIVWQDMPSGGNCKIDWISQGLAKIGMKNDDTLSGSRKRAGRDSKESREDYKRELGEMIDHLYNSPCVAVWVPFNEHWGQFDANEITGFIQRKDSTRLVDQASGFSDQGGGDFFSIHTYFSKLKKPKTDGRIFVISEAGGFGHGVKDHSWPARKFSYGAYKTTGELQKRYTDFIQNEVLPLRKKGLSALIYTQLSDVEIENNGIYTYDRRFLKFDPWQMRHLHELVKK
ncbi:MAG: glycoside hydrolase family 2, partial [Erysipelotrichales bacterium]|nr:glycoside hydrolase family 2 [Erysipelotrichales bacterium]